MTTEIPLPLFYKAPELLSPATHGDWRLRDGDVSFAAQTAFVPIVVSEIAAASSSYPVVFASGDAQPIVVTGIEETNLFVNEGRWAGDAYVPAYVRRYPFGFIATVNPDGFALAIDTASTRFAREAAEGDGGEAGIALFENGEPTGFTRQALTFCDAFQTDAVMTRAFTDALREHDLLIDQRADVVLPDGDRRGVEGFQIVDAERFAKLEDAVVLDWHRKGWLALVHFHIASLQRFQALLLRRAGRLPDTAETVAELPQDNAKAPEIETLFVEKA